MTDGMAVVYNACPHCGKDTAEIERKLNQIIAGQHPAASDAPAASMPVPEAGMSRIDWCRSDGLRLAVDLHARDERIDGVLADRVNDTAGRLSRWLLAKPHHLRLHPSLFTFEQGSPGPGQPTNTG